MSKSKNHVHDALKRLDAVRLRLENPWSIPATLFASEDVPIEAQGAEQAFELLSLADTLDQLAEKQRAGRIAPFWGEVPGEIRSLVLTPDFHKGTTVPIGTVLDARGFVLPGAIGSDICCGMRLLVTDLRREDLEPHLDTLERHLRNLFFEGGRDIPMSPRQREAMLREGLSGLVATCEENQGTGLWRYFDRRQQERDLERVDFGGGLRAQGIFSFADFVRASGRQDGRDPHIGSVGGGNHFVELQTVDELSDGATARLWGVPKDAVVIMVHTGSLGLGRAVGEAFREKARALYPANVPQPRHGYFVLPTNGPLSETAESYLDAMRNAANFGFANRLFLGLMALRALSETLGRQVGATLVHDAPHNLVWPVEGGERWLHRKGACPARGAAPEERSPYRYTGQPVMVPGSMGAPSFLLAGLGSEEALVSAPHGAGRSLTRGASAHVDEATYRKATERLRVVMPIDPTAPATRLRRDILEKYHRELKEEAPYAYKPITPIIETIEQAGIARTVARLRPVLTVKG